MRGNAALLCILMVVTAARTDVAAQIQIGPGGALTIIQPRGPQNAQPMPMSSVSGDLLQFLDGSFMHGGLKSMDTSSGLSWENPAAKQPIDLQPSHIDSIRFDHAGSVVFSPTSRVHFANGDDLYGTVNSLDSSRLGFSTWFGESRAIPREAVQSITFLSGNYHIIYEGPDNASGWIVGNRNPDSWTYRDGTFISSSTGSLGREFKLSGSATIEFDLAWSDLFDLQVNLYYDNQNYGNSYLLDLTRDQASLRAVDTGQLAPLRAFGTAPLPPLAGKDHARFTIQANKDEGTIALFADGKLVKRWKDENGFSATGGGILFMQQDLSGGVLKLSNITVSEWSGRYEPETAGVPTNSDVIRFINHDQASGKIEAIAGGKVRLALGEAHLEIPIQRVTQINFAEIPSSPPRNGPWEVRAQFARGGSVSFQLEKWGEKEVSGRSPIFGQLAFAPGQIRRLEFNLDRPKVQAPITPEENFESLDE